MAINPDRRDWSGRLCSSTIPPTGIQAGSILHNPCGDRQYPTTSTAQSARALRRLAFFWPSTNLNQATPDANVIRKSSAAALLFHDFTFVCAHSSAERSLSGMRPAAAVDTTLNRDTRGLPSRIAGYPQMDRFAQHLTTNETNTATDCGWAITLHGGMG